MRVSHQKNVYYVDINKNIYRGYIETSISKESNEKFIVYRSAYLEIEEVVLIDSMEKLHFEYFNTKTSKDKLKIPKVIIKSKNKPITEDENKQIHSEDDSSSSTEKYYDAFRVKIPDEINDSSFKIRISFKPVDSNPSILWYKPVSDKDKHKEVIASNPFYNSSCIAPYIDTITNMELYYIIPNTEEVKVISSGTFKSIREEDRMIIYLYGAYTHPKYLSFVVGTYDQCDIFNDNDKRKLLLPYSIETNKTEIINDLQAIIKYIESFTKTNELSSCNVVFSLIPIDNIVSKNMVILKYSYIPSSKDIEMAYLLKRILSECLSQQVYHFMNWSLYDAWIYHGFSGYLADYCIRYLLGNNEFLFNYIEDKQYVIDRDIMEYPLFYTLRKEHECYSEFFKKKTRLVFHCMESHLSFAFLQKISDEIIEARRIEQKQELLLTDLRKCFTPRFIKIVKDSTGKDLRGFFDFYLFRPGLMKIKLGLNINKKKNTVNVIASYLNTSQLPGANKKPMGNINIKSIELEGNFDHEISFEGENVFMYHTRTKKKKKEEVDEEIMPLLYIRADTKRENLFEYIVEQPDYMYIEQLQDKNIIGQFEAIQGLKNKPTLASCEALEKLLDNSHVFYKIRIKVSYVLRFINIEEYNGFQRMIQYFIRNRCVANSTVLKSNEFGLISYFIQKHLVKSLSQISDTLRLEDSKIVIAFLENILKFNDNSLSQFEDSWYISTVINLFVKQSAFISCYKSPITEVERLFKDYSGDAKFITTEDFIRTNKSIHKTTDESTVIQNCFDELERFRISDMVFPSNSNIITRTCLISYIRLSYYNKMRISKDSLMNLAKYPNLYSIRLPAIEGLLILFSDTLPFILKMAYEEVSYMTQKILEIILNVLMLDLRVHLIDTDEYEVKLSEVLRGQLCKSTILNDINNRHFNNVKIVSLIRKLKDDDKYEYDFVKEENNRQAILRIPSMSKRIKINNMESLRIAAFEENMILRLPRIKNYKPKLQKDKYMKIRIRPSKFLIKHKGEYMIRFKIKKGIIKRTDIPIVLINKYCENKLCLIIDESITKSKSAGLFSTGFFPWTPQTSKEIQDFVREEKPPVETVFKELEKSLIFVLSYNTMISKPYQTAKVLYNRIEYIYLYNSFIKESISPMTVEGRRMCEEFLESVRNQTKYSIFSYPVDTTELKNYLDIVRVPVSFYDVYLNLPSYNSLDAFVVHMERIYQNCLNYNDSKSEIALTALELKEEIDRFKRSLKLEYVNSKDIIKRIFETYDTENVIDYVIERIEEIKTWGDIEDELVLLKKKFSRSSHNGKIAVSIVKNVREELKNWFLFDGVRTLV